MKENNTGFIRVVYGYYIIFPYLFTRILFCLQNDFNFEMRDWMTVQTKELPTGSKLVGITHSFLTVETCIRIACPRG